MVGHPGPNLVVSGHSRNLLGKWPVASCYSVVCSMYVHAMLPFTCISLLYTYVRTYVASHQANYSIYYYPPLILERK